MKRDSDGQGLVDVDVALSGAVLVALTMLGLAGCAPEPVPEPVASEARTAAARPTPSPEVTPTLAPSPDAAPAKVTCEDIATPELIDAMAGNGWISWEIHDATTGYSPFADFPGGAPERQLVCRWGKDPERGTDNVFDVAWAPMGATAATQAQGYLAARGFERIEAVEGVYLTVRGDETQMRVDGEGFGETFLFTDSEVRWSHVKADVRYIQSPDD